MVSKRKEFRVPKLNRFDKQLILSIKILQGTYPKIKGTGLLE
jgi:hypothetical protein